MAASKQQQQQKQPISLDAPICESLAPSDVISHDRNVRAALCNLLCSAQLLKLSVETVYSAAVLLHRYHLAVSAAASATVSKYDPNDWIVAACLFLACKNEEEPRRLRDVINCAHMIHAEYAYATAAGVVEDEDFTQQQKQQQLEESRAVAVTLHYNPQPPDLDESYWKAKAKVVQVEQVVLRWLEFDVLVAHPHRAVVLLVQDAYYYYYDEKTLTTARSINDRASSPALSEIHTTTLSSPEMHQLIFGAWQRLNDSVFSVACLQCSALSLAIAAIRLAILQENKDVFAISAAWARLSEMDQWKCQAIKAEDIQIAQERLELATNSLLGRA
jgi:hypothetical protein